MEVEYAVQMKCDSCRENIIGELSKIDGISIVSVVVKDQRLLVKLEENGPTATEIQELIEKKLKLNTIIRGTGDFVSAVSEMHGSSSYPNVKGVARFTQNESKHCLLDAVIDGLDDSKMFTLGIHEFGDLSQQSDLHSVGRRIFAFGDKSFQPKASRLTAKVRVNDCDLSSFVGRSFAIVTKPDIIVSAGIVARASRILDNTKQICDCSGKTLWQERDERQT